MGPLSIRRNIRAALCCAVVAAACIILCICYTGTGGSRRSAESPFSINPTANLFDEEMIGKLNYDIWRAIVGYHVDDMRFKRDFPSYPEERKGTDCLKVSFSEKAPTSLYESDAHGKYAHKIYGYIGPPQSGPYTFSIEMRDVTAACTAEFWMSSDFHPGRLRKIVVLEYPELGRPQEPTGVRVESEEIELSSGQVYYLEFLEKAFDGQCTVEIKWKTPQQNYFRSIPSNYLAMAVKLDVLGRYTTWPVLSALKSHLPSNSIQSHSHVKNLADKIYPITSVNVLPKCQIHMVLVQKLKQYWQPKSSYKVIGSKVYPPDDTWHMDGAMAKQGNDIIEPGVVKKVLSLYAKAYQEKDKRNPWRFECWFKQCSRGIELRYMEETVNGADGSRFLLELNIRNGADTLHTSEYVYLPANSERLCQARNFQWADDVDVYLVITVKNVGYWVKHLIHNMEYIYAHTRDEHFEVVIVDFESEDIDVEKELQKSSLKRWKVIKLQGPFVKTTAHNEAILQYVKDPDSIVMTLDLHLTVPLGFIEYVRRHVVKGKMAFAPVFFKLNQGYTEINMNGHWGLWTYGLLALYKSDWTAFGGFNNKKFQTTWGDEDWDVADRTLSAGYEIFRIRYPGMVHYYHGRAGMWQWTDDKQSETKTLEPSSKPMGNRQPQRANWNQVHSVHAPDPQQSKLQNPDLSLGHHKTFSSWSKRTVK